MSRNMKKLLVIFMTAISIMASLVGCGSSSSSGSVSGSGMKIFCSFPDIDDSFRAALAAGLETAATSTGVTMDIEMCGSEIDAQVKAIEEAANSGEYDAIICRLIDSSTALQMEVAAGDLPIIFLNNEPDEDYLEADKYVYVGSYEQDAGTYQAQYLWEALGSPSSLDIIILEGEQGHSGAIGRTNAVKYFFRDNDVDANIVFMDYANWSDSEAYEKLEVFKMTNQNFDCIFCNNDTMALGAVQWLNDNGYSTSDKLVAGVDATSDGCQSIQNGGMYMTVLQDADNQALQSVNAAIVLGKGNSISELEGATDDLMYIWVEYVPVDSSNVSSYL